MADKELKRGSDGYYRIRFNYEGKQYSVKAKTPKELYQKEQQKREELENGTEQLEKKMTVSEWADEWIETFVKPRVRAPGEDKKKGTMSRKSFEIYLLNVKFVKASKIGKMRLKDVRRSDLQNLMNSLSGQNESTVKKVHWFIKAMFRDAYSDRRILFDPAVALKLPITTKGHRRAMNEEEYKAFKMAAEISPHGLWFRLLLGTGIRPGEGFALQVKDFDFVNSSLNVDKAIESGTTVASMPKTRAGVRKIPIPPDLLLPLQAAFVGKSPDDLAFPRTDTGYKFSQKKKKAESPDGTPEPLYQGKTSSSAYKEWKSFHRLMDICAGAQTIFKGKVHTMEKDGFEKTNMGRILEEEIDGVDGHALPRDLDLYCLRHTYCTNLKKAGVDMYRAQYYMGHASSQITASIYTDNNDTDLLQTDLEKISAWTLETAKQA